MIKITDTSGATHYLHPNAIARIVEAGVSSKWHGIQAYVKTFDGKTIEARESAVDIARQVESASGAAGAAA